jgi:hypothetical protein
MTDNNFWKDEDVIFSYTDDEAVEDGILVPVKYGEICFVTNSIIGDFEKIPEEIRSLIINKFLTDAMKTFEAKRKKKDDWFYEITVWKKKYFVAMNGKSLFTLMKPEDY